MSLIRVKDLVLGYEGRPILRDLTFTVEPGDYLLIVGDNGTGKTTLMRTLLGLISPLSGEIERDIVPGDLGYLPQQTPVQRDFPASVREVVYSGFLNQTGLRPFYTHAERKAAHDVMDKMEILSLRDACYRDLSGGQQQRVLLARALLSARKILLLDEPVTGLDPAMRTQMYHTIQDLHQRDGMTILMISHDIRTAMDDATHILHIGNPCFFGTRAAYEESTIGQQFLAASGGEP